MSEMNDNILYNFYDYVKSIYIYSHLKTYLLDKERQEIEIYTNGILVGLSILFLLVSLFKIFVIIFYFLFIQAFSAFISFIIAIYKTRLKINFCSSFKNALFYLAKVFRRIYTFNFYLYDNVIIGFVMIFSYFFFLSISCIFYYENYKLIQSTEKPKYYMILFYCHFESVVLIQLLCSSFYAYRNMKKSTLIAFGLFFIMNIILALGYKITNIIEDVDGSFEYDQPQSVMNIIFNSIFLFLNSISLCNFIFYKKKGKFIFN